MPDPTFRLADWRDEAELLRWRNDPETIAWSFTHCTVSPEEHHAWLRNRIEENRSPTGHPKLYIAELDGKPVGVVRIRGGIPPQIDYTVAPEHRRKGIGTELVRFAASRGTEDSVCAMDILTGNAASVRIAEKCGFAPEFVRYVRRGKDHV
jgi:RimJ/RimL family protein N-acetyltransferase